MAPQEKLRVDRCVSKLPIRVEDVLAQSAKTTMEAGFLCNRESTERFLDTFRDGA